jgi:type VI secretion system protein ImpG
MDPRLLEYYNRELNYLRELGTEFAQQYPKVALRLGMQGIDVADPYVERLLEGFAFLSARINLKYDAEFPRFSQRLLEVVYPNYLAPTPAMCVVEMILPADKASVLDGFTVKRGSQMRARMSKDERTACEFQTAHNVTLWPIEVTHARVSGAPPDLPLNSMPVVGKVRGSIRLRMRLTAPIPPERLKLDELTFFLRGTDEVVSRLYERLFAHCVGVVISDTERPARIVKYLDKSAVCAEGFSENQSLLPYQSRGFQGYRLLHEYFAFPPRFWFFTVKGLRNTLKSMASGTFDITILLDAECADLEQVIDANYFALNCTPAVNLSPRKADRIAITGERNEYHVVVDRSRPMDHEVYSLTSVEGFSEDNTLATRFDPFYSTVTGSARQGHGAYYSVRREPRLMSDTARRHGPRTSYVGSEVFLSLVDQNEAPFKSNLQQVAVSVLVTNRDLSLIMPLGGDSDFTLVSSAPVAGIRVVRGPSRPTPAIAERDVTWRLISHLSLNYLALTDLGPAEGARALRELLDLYAALAEPTVRKQIEGITSMAIQSVTRRLPGKGPLVFGRGLAGRITVDEAQFSGMNPFLFGAVLEEFFARHVSMNSFTELTLDVASSGKLHTWPPRFGTRPIV